METLYFFKLPTLVNGQTHVRVSQEIVDGNRINIHGEYGVLNRGTQEFTPGEAMHAFDVNILGEEREDLIIESNAGARPAALKDHEFREADLVAHLEADPVARQSRIVARRPAPPVDPEV